MRRKREEGVVYQNQKKKEKCCITALDYQCDGFQAKRATTPTRGGCGNGASETGLLSQTHQPFIAPRVSISPPSLLSPWSGAGRLPHTIYFLFPHISLFIFIYGSL